MWPIKSILYFAAFWFGCFAALANPIWGVANYMLVYQVHPPAHWWGEPLTAIGMRFSWMATSFIVLGLVFARKHVPRVKPALSLWELWIGALIFLGVLNTIAGIGFESSARYAFEKFWKMQVFVLILGRLATTRKNLKVVIWTIVVGSLYLGYDAYTAPAWRFSLGRLDVFGGPDMATSSGASAHLAAMLPIIGVAFLVSKQWRFKLLAATAGMLTVNAIILCRTRSAFIGLLAGGVAAAVLAPRAKRYRIYLLMLLGGVVATALTDTHYRERMATLTDEETLNEDPAVVARADIWAMSGELVLDHPLGVGLGNFSRAIGNYDVRYWNRSSHSTVVTCFAELGIIGGLVFLAIVIESVRLVYRSSKRAHLSANPLETKLICYGLLVSVTTYMVTGLGTERFFCESLWWVLVLPLCLHRVVIGESACGADVPEHTLRAEPVVGFQRYGEASYAT